MVTTEKPRGKRHTPTGSNPLETSLPSASESDSRRAEVLTPEMVDSLSSRVRKHIEDPEDQGPVMSMLLDFD